VLGVFHGGAHRQVIQYILDIKEDTADQFVHSLIDVGLAEDMSYGHLQLDPALPPYLLSELSATEAEAARTCWANGMQKLMKFLYQQHFQNTELSTALTLLELPNLIACLRWAAEHTTTTTVVNLSVNMEMLLTSLSHPLALAQARQIRKQASKKLDEWSHTHFIHEIANIDHLLEQECLQEALTTAYKLCERMQSMEGTSEPLIDYDIAKSHLQLGIALNRTGKIDAALQSFHEAQRRFHMLVNTMKDTYSAQSLAIAISNGASCQMHLGLWDAAEKAYRVVIALFTMLDDLRNLTVSKHKLGIVLFKQQRFIEALKVQDEAQVNFEKLNEPDSVAKVLHEKGIVYTHTKQFEKAERAHHQALAIRVQRKLVVDEAASLIALGNLYSKQDQKDRLEEAAKFYRQAAQIFSQLKNQCQESITRNNLAATLIKLTCYTDARHEVYKAIKCSEPCGDSAEPWKTWYILYQLERNIGDHAQAIKAWQQAKKCYLTYCQKGGERRGPEINLCINVLQALQHNDMDKINNMKRLLAAPWLDNSDSTERKTFLNKLQNILNGSRNLGIVDDPDLDYMDAVELQLLLERLASN
jgi:tetratricopeptide (TPR) repeat protein